MVHIAATPAESNLALAQALCVATAHALRQRGWCSWVLCGGHTPRSLFELMVTPRWRVRVDWSRVEFFWGDERAVPPDDAQSNFRLAHESLLVPLRIEPGRIHRMHGEDADLAAAAQAYEHEIATVLGLDGAGVPNAFDIVLLGLGADAHTASLFPATAALETNDRAVVANEVPQLKTRRLTMTASRLNHAVAKFFLVHGADKADAVAAVHYGKRDPHRYPAQLIVNADWFLDAAAAARLADATP